MKKKVRVAVGEVGGGKHKKDHKPSDLEGLAQIINVHMSIITL
jgi:hypothetical protein